MHTLHTTANFMHKSTIDGRVACKYTTLYSLITTQPIKATSLWP